MVTLLPNVWIHPEKRGLATRYCTLSPIQLVILA
jgi:hypothetical protein